ncbi:hypothetical protein IMCC26256_112096 [Actinobacteria bacterium IMCC26256]|nr:hypothetical protein IMCC26256_112096 [Actinobacteria bacterium IMCC26256]
MGERVRTRLRSQDFAATSRTFNLLGFSACVRSDADLVPELVELLWAPLLSDMEPEHVFTVTQSPPDINGIVAWHLHLDALHVVSAPALSIVVSHLLWEANRQALENTPGHALLHSAAVTSGEDAAIIVGPQGSGKSTLAVALVARYGLGYLTDEAVAISPNGLPDGLMVQPYAKYISVGAHIGEILPEVSPISDPALVSLLGELVLVPASSLRAESIVAAARPSVVVLPTYIPNAPTKIQVLSPASALHSVGQHSYHLARDTALVMDTLAAVTSSARCITLTSGDLDEACQVVLDLLSHESSGTAS